MTNPTNPIPTFKIRCSQIGKIMTEPKSKSETLSETTKTYCETWLKEQLYSKEKEVHSKYLDKGNGCEPLSIERYNNTFGTFLSKNTETFENDWSIGTPDLIAPTKIIDIKNSWDCFTFPLFKTEIPSSDYYYQLQGYMYLTGRKQAELVYTLEDLPLDLALRELEKAGLEPTDENFALYSYDNVPDHLRIKVFAIEYDPEVIEKVKRRVEECREYIAGLTTHLASIKITSKRLD